VTAYRRGGLSAGGETYRRGGKRIGVSAWGRVGVSACRRVAGSVACSVMPPKNFRLSSEAPPCSLARGSSVFERTEDEDEFEFEDDVGNDFFCEKGEPPARLSSEGEARRDEPGHLLVEARRVTHSSPPIVLVLGPSVEFLLKSSRVHALGCS
jgi:hypothetical protein